MAPYVAVRQIWSKHIMVCCHFLLGCVEFLEQPAMAFVRLNEAVLLESVLEVPVPVRFLFVLLGPSQSNVDYHEIGRSFSTLMSDKVNVNFTRGDFFFLIWMVK